jgi:leucyl aminopeptidase (aminopeptidase T)
VLEARRGEKLTIICDQALRSVGDAFSKAALDLGLWTRMVVLPKPTQPRTEIPPLLESAIIEGRSEIFVNFLKGGADETPFRITLTKLEKRRRTRLGHCPGITLDMLTQGALALSEEDYRRIQARADELMAVCHGATGVRVTNPGGTDLRFSVNGRAWFTDTKLNWETLKWMNLPVGEVIVGPEEFSAEGKLVCKTAIGGVGIIKKPLTLDVVKGRVESVTCASQEVKALVEKVQSTDDWARRIGEFAFGLNTRARMIQEFLETEKRAGTVHVAFGGNSDFPGGKNHSRTHQDFLISKPTVTVEFGKEKKEILKDGKFVYTI